MKTYTAELHFRERPESNQIERWFDAWIVGAQNLFPTLADNRVLNSHQAIAHKNLVEKKAWEFGQGKKFDDAGNPVDAECQVKIIFENF